MNVNKHNEPNMVQSFPVNKADECVKSSSHSGNLGNAITHSGNIGNHSGNHGNHIAHSGNAVVDPRVLSHSGSVGNPITHSGNLSNAVTDPRCENVFARVPDADSVAVARKPISSADFEAMIPPHFLTGSSAPQTQGLVDAGGIHVALPTRPPGNHPMVACDNNMPENIRLGQCTETLTKTTLTETTVTRTTDNKLAQVPLITEVRV